MERYYAIAKCLDIWMNLREKNHSINDYFKVRNIRKVGIYGYGILGKHLFWELEQSDDAICVSWILDQRAERIMNLNCQVLQPEMIEKIEEPDLIVVSAINDFEEIEMFISEKTRVSVLSLESIIIECNMELQMEHTV